MVNGKFCVKCKADFEGFLDKHLPSELEEQVRRFIENNNDRYYETLEIVITVDVFCGKDKERSDFCAAR